MSRQPTTSHEVDRYPLTGLQQAFLWHSLAEAASPIGMQQPALVLRGPLDVAAYARAWQLVLDRHSMLRTAFAWEDLEQPVQIVYRDVSIGLEVRDWTDRQPADQQRQLREDRLASRRRGFDLTRAPLMRLVLTRLEPETHQLDWTFHHLIMDGWSVALVLAEVHAIYDALCAGRPLDLEPAVPFRDYINWLEEQNPAEEEAYWRAALDGWAQPSLLQLQGIARATPPDDSAEASHVRKFSAAESAAVRSLARRAMVSLGTIAYGAWAVLLSRYSGREDVVFGAVVNGRPEELEGVTRMVGMFINNLPVRVRVDPSARLSSWLKEIQGAQVAAQQFASTPPGKVREWCAVPARLPLFDSLMVFQNLPSDTTLGEEHFGGLRLEGGQGGVIDSAYPITVTMGLIGSDLGMVIAYDRRSFDAPSIERIADQLRTVLLAMAADADAPLGTLDVLAIAPSLDDGGHRQAIISGVRFDLDEIEHHVRQHPAVRDCAVGVVPNADGEPELVAHVVPASVEAPSSQELRAFLRKTLPDSMQPWMFRSVPDLEGLAPSVPADERSRDGVETKLVQLWQRALGVTAIGIHDNFFDLGGTSFLAGRLLDQIEREFDRRLSLSVLLRGATILDLANVLRGAEIPPEGLVAIDVFNGEGSKPPLFCAHGPFEYVLYYRHIAEHLGPDQPVYVLRWNIAHPEGAHIRSLEDLAARYIQAARAIQPEGPYYLLGHSFGAWAAYEMAQQLHAAGQSVDLLAMLDMGVREYQRLDVRTGLVALAEKAHRWLHVFPRLQPHERHAQLRERLRRWLTPRQIDTVSGDAAARLSSAYQLRPYPGRVTVFWAEDVPRPLAGRRDPREGWAELAAGLEIIPVPGDHVLMLTEPRVHVLGEAVRTCLVRAQSDHRTPSSASMRVAALA